MTLVCALRIHSRRKIMDRNFPHQIAYTRASNLHIRCIALRVHLEILARRAILATAPVSNSCQFHGAADEEPASKGRRSRRTNSAWILRREQMPRIAMPNVRAAGECGNALVLAHIPHVAARSHSPLLVPRPSRRTPMLHRSVVSIPASVLHEVINVACDRIGMELPAIARRLVIPRLFVQACRNANL